MIIDVIVIICRVLANPVVLCDKCRLHGVDNDVVVCESFGNCHDLADHANAAQELARECERLRAERAHLLRAWENGEDSVLAAAARSVVATLMAEVERLRERVGVLEAALRATVELAEWMSGSSDFDALGNWAEGRATCDNSRRILEGC